MSVDPVQANPNTGASFNRYWYANNNPYRFTDPDGRQALTRIIEAIFPPAPARNETHEDEAPQNDSGGENSRPTERPSRPTSRPSRPTREGNRESPEITSDDLSGKSRAEIKDLANCKGLCPSGDQKDPDYPRKWKDPVTGKERLRLDRGHRDPKTGKPFENDRAAKDHAHGYDQNGRPIRDETGDKHFPTTGE